jgi:hypothetical protein
MMSRLLALVLIICLLSLQLAYAQDSECDLETRLIVGQEGRVLQEMTVNVRQDPGISGAYLGRMPSAGMFTVVDGPQCVDGYQWWQVDYHHAEVGMVGWVAEGDAAEYWLEPRGIRTVVADVNGVDRYHIELPDGTTEPEGCLAPPDDYTRVQLGYAEVNARTLFMLDHADQLYTAAGHWSNFRAAITQGSFSDSVDASFGTHSGGGAVDISVMSNVEWTVREDVDEMIYYLRVAGFAAWFREAGLFYTDSPVHIHAIAVGDEELSDAARAQIDGDGGYLRGLDGLIEDYGGPRPDSYGPVVCQWMVEQGFGDLREEVVTEP